MARRDSYVVSWDSYVARWDSYVACWGMLTHMQWFSILCYIIVFMLTFAYCFRLAATLAQDHTILTSAVVRCWCC